LVPREAVNYNQGARFLYDASAPSWSPEDVNGAQQRKSNKGRKLGKKKDRDENRMEGSPE
jgi:hypothetical protein